MEKARKNDPVYLGPEAPKSGRFMTLSVLIHASMLAAVTFMTFPKYDAPVREVVEFEVASDTLGPVPISDGTTAPESKGATEELPPAPEVKSAAAPVIAPKVQVAPPAPEIIPVAPKAVKSAPVQTLPAKAAPVAAAASTIDDIRPPHLETSENGEVAVPKFEDKDLNDDFERVDNENNKKLRAVQKNLDDEAAKVAAENAATAAAAEKQNREETKALAAAHDARRAKEAKAIADARAAETAAAGKVAREASQKEARDAAAAAINSAGQSDEGEGTGVSGSPAPTKEVAGIPGGVRGLDQLRQKPGNKLPQYDRAERLAGLQGHTLFYAYVNKDGSLSQFKMGESTGHRSLDAKTLAALKNWKFYPGQEGWVEMPYEWVLRGDALEAGGQLRNQVR